jgi:hypothetical protein
MSHANAPLTVEGRRQFGELGLRDRSSTPLRQPNATEGTVIAQIGRMRR